MSSLSCKDKQALEKRRIEAIKLKRKGLKPVEIAEKFGVSRAAVSQWLKAYDNNGRKGLKTKGKPGPKPQLDNRQRLKIKRALLKSPLKYGYKTELWTLERISSLIFKLTQVRFHPGYVWYWLGNLGFSCQKPQAKTKQRNEQKIARWLRYSWPQIKRGRSRTAPE